MESSISSNVKLIKMTEDHLVFLFEFQLDKDANQMAAFTAINPSDKEIYFSKWRKLLLNQNVNAYSIFLGTLIVGSIVKFVIEEESEITYWIDKAFWGKGIATSALKIFLEIESTRPLYARAAFDNKGSQKVLMNCGFIKVGSETSFAQARGKEIEEYIYVQER